MVMKRAIIAAAVLLFTMANAAPAQAQEAYMDPCARAVMCMLAVMASAVEKGHMPPRMLRDAIDLQLELFDEISVAEDRPLLILVCAAKAIVALEYAAETEPHGHPCLKEYQ